jgi:CII-binding regulator of phage lambda lysogenization HflD
MTTNQKNGIYCDDIIEVRVFVARIDERLKSIESKLDSTLKQTEELDTRIQRHEKSITNFKSDQKWIVGIFSTLFTIAISVFKFSK